MPPTVEHQIFDGVEKKLCKARYCKKINPNGVWKPLSEFGKSSSEKDGLKNMCKNCKNTSQKEKPICLVENEVIEDSKPTIISTITKANLEKFLTENGFSLVSNINNFTSSKSSLDIKCKFEHISSNIRLDSLKARIRDFQKHTRYAICSECHNKKIKDNEYEECKKFIEEIGFTLIKLYHNERGDITLDISCKNGHIIEGRVKSSIERGCICRECILDKDTLYCPGCSQDLTFDKFNHSEPNTHRHKLDHYCKNCREKQNNKRKENGYKIPSNPKMIIDGIDGKMCSSYGCGFHSYNDFYKDVCDEDGFSKHCKDCKDTFSKKYIENNKEAVKEYRKNYNIENKEQLAENKKEWKKNNIEKYRENSRNYIKNRREIDPGFRIKMNMRHRINLALKGSLKSKRTMELLGCDIDYLWKSLESKFADGMTRENYGSVWHLDHIIPCSKFDLTKEENQAKCFHYKNLQPLFCEDNLAKSDKYDFDIVKEMELHAAVFGMCDPDSDSDFE
jgi:hypothetical protein